VYAYPLLPSAHAASVTLTVSPTEGYVGEKINLSGQIDNANGNYTVFFDSTKVANGAATSLRTFTNFFYVPRARYGNHSVTLRDDGSGNTTIVNFKVKTSYEVWAFNVPTYPAQLQEGSVVIVSVRMLGANATTSYPKNVTLTTPANKVYCNSMLTLTTDENGTAESVPALNYPTDFLPAAGHTNYTGTYQLRLYKNATTTLEAQSTFTIGLTNATLYQRLEWVNIKAMNYTKPNESAIVTIKLGNKSLTSQTILAVDGIIMYNWQVPINASSGSYKVNVTTATPSGTIKSIADIQNFTVPGISVKILTKNLVGEPLSGVNATIYRVDPSNASKKTKVASGLTNATGWITNTLSQGGNYTFRAFWKSVLVNETQAFIQNDSSWTLICQITHMEFTARDGKTGLPVPFIFFRLNINYFTFTNVSRAETEAYQSNATGKWLLRNQLVKANYTIRAYRTELLFNTTAFFIPQGQPLFKMNVTLPVFNLTIHAEDAKRASLGGFPVKIYEYAGGLYDEATTAVNSGNVTITATFGRYKLRLYNPASTIVLNETYYALTTANTSFILRGAIYNANLSVHVVDYFGQPVSNVRVKFEREGTTPTIVNTGANGIAFFGGNGFIGGDGFVSIYFGDGEPVETAPVYVADNAAVTFALGKYVSFFGMIVDSAQFGVLITLIVIIALFVLFMLYRRRKGVVSSEKPAEKES